MLAERRAGGHPDAKLIKRDDLLGPREISLEDSPALQRLQKMEGLTTVKVLTNGRKGERVKGRKGERANGSRARQRWL